jgi:hypothetical protein
MSEEQRHECLEAMRCCIDELENLDCESERNECIEAVRFYIDELEERESREDPLDSMIFFLLGLAPLVLALYSRGVVEWDLSWISF